MRCSNGIQCPQGRLRVADDIELVRVAHADPLARPVDLHGPSLVEFGHELGVGEVGSRGQQRVAVHHQMPARSRAEQADRLGHPRQIIGQDVLAQQCLGRSGAEQVGDLGQLFDAVPGTLADQHRHLLTGVEQVRGLPHRGIVRGDPCRRDSQAGGHLFEGVPGRLVLQVEDVGGNDDACRSARAERDADGPVDEIGQLLGHGAHLDVFAAHVFEQADQVDFLLIGAAHRRAFGLPDDGHHRDMVELRVVETVEQVDRPGAAGRHTHPDVAGELRVTDGLERGHLLMARLHELGFVPGPLPRREQPVDAVTGEPEHLADSPFPQSGQQNISDGI